jgi:HEAT repeat protein
VIDALADPDDGVRRAALSSVGPVRHEPTIAAVAKLVRESTSWPLRVRAAEALGRLGGPGAPGLLVQTLASAARTDSYALVREAAARALAPLDRSVSVPVLRDLAAKDPEPRVRQTATELLRSAGETPKPGK